MTSLLLERLAPVSPPLAASSATGPCEALSRPQLLATAADPGTRTLDQLVTRAWEGLSADRTVSCPVCHGRMAPRYGSGPGAVGGRCTGCGSVLG